MMWEITVGIIIGGVILYLMKGTIEVIAEKGEPDSLCGKVAKNFWNAVGLLIGVIVLLVYFLRDKS